MSGPPVALWFVYDNDNDCLIGGRHLTPEGAEVERKRIIRLNADNASPEARTYPSWGRVVGPYRLAEDDRSNDR